MVKIHQSERLKSSGKYASLFGYFANFTPKFEPITLYQSHDVEMEIFLMRKDTHRIRFIAVFVLFFYGLPRVQGSFHHMTPLPHPARGMGEEGGHV